MVPKPPEPAVVVEPNRPVDEVLAVPKAGLFCPNREVLPAPELGVWPNPPRRSQSKARRNVFEKHRERLMSTRMTISTKL